MKQCIASAAALLCAGCALGVPTGVRVRTAPTIRVPVSSDNSTVELEHYFSAKIIQNLLVDYPDAEIYQYGKDNTLHILVRYNLVEVSLKDILKDTNKLEENLKEMEFPYEYKDDARTIISIDISNLIEVNKNPITNVDLAHFAQKLPGNLGFKSVAAKIYAGPANNDYRLRGIIYAERDSEDKIVILGVGDSPTKDDIVKFKGELLPLKKDEESHVLTPADIKNYPEPSFSTDENGTSLLAETFNARPKNLSFYFDVAPEFGNIPRRVTLSVADISKMNSLQFYVDMVLDISLAFVVANPAESAVMRLADVVGDSATNKQDIFGRETPKENSSLFDGVQDVTLRLNYDNSLLSSDLTAKIWVRPDNQKHALTVRDFTVKPGRNQTSEVALDTDYVRKHLLKPKDMELEFVPDKDGTLFSFGPGNNDPESSQYGVGGSFTLIGVEVETVLDHTFSF